MIKCGLCDWFANSPIVTKGDKGTLGKRKCVAKKMRRASDSEACKYFKANYFYCDQFNQRLKFEQCLSRRRNPKGFNSYSKCKKCRQFDKEIRPIIEAYWLDMVPIVTPRHLQGQGESDVPPLRKIKRRNKEQQGPTSKRKIKRRESTGTNKKKRTIKRRSKPATGDNGLQYTLCPQCGMDGMRENYCRICQYKPEQAKRKIKRRR